MKLNLNVEIDDQNVKIAAENLDISIGTILNKDSIFLITKNRKLLEVTSELPELLESETVIALQDKNQIEKEYLVRALVEKAKDAKVKLRNYKEEGVVPTNFVKPVNLEVIRITTILDSFGYELFGKKKVVKAKATHRWSKEISKIPFTVNTLDCSATVYWKKRNEMLIIAGAKLRKEMPLNKDGSVGFSARLGEKIRTDHQDELNGLVTTADVTLKSVNEVGLFLYFGGTNGWLQLKDETGKTINEYTVVN